MNEYRTGLQIAVQRSLRLQYISKRSLACGRPELARVLDQLASCGRVVGQGHLLLTTFSLTRLRPFISWYTSTSLLCVSVRLYPNQAPLNRHSGILINIPLRCSRDASVADRTTRYDAIKAAEREALSTVSPNLESKGFNEYLTPEHAIYLSTSTDPLFNLTLEDWLFRNASASSPLLLIYRDSPCVVIGRNQNPWTEVNFPALRTVGTTFVRRRSGGGTVYHDLGNTNFSIHLPQSSFDRRATGNVILGAVRSLGIDAQLNDRNDICIGPYKIRSAYKLANKRSYHHGTMLISTKLEDLGELLRPQEDNIVTKGVASVRSPVSNLQLANPRTTHEGFTSAVVDAFRKEYRVDSGICVVKDTEDIRNMEFFHNGMAELSRWDWAFGQTPEFIRTLNKTFPWGQVSVEIRSKHGIILDCSLEFKNAQVNPTTTIQVAKNCASFCVGQRYGFLKEAPEGGQDTGFSEHSTSGSEPAEWLVPTQDTKNWLLHTLGMLQ